MAFFARNFYQPQASPTSFTPLFRLLDDFDSYSRQCGPATNNQTRASLPQFQPKFDVREVANAFELHGELPGVSKENVQIEFTQPQTMIVRGRVERTYTAGTSPNGASEEDEATDSKPEERERKNSHQATVEDEEESTAHESGFEEIESPVTDHQVQKVATAPVVEQKKKPADKAKYWLTERNIGEFSRTFNFPSRVDQDTVTASFQDGILTVVVPKAKKHESRRITVN